MPTATGEAAGDAAGEATGDGGVPGLGGALGEATGAGVGNGVAWGAELDEHAPRTIAAAMVNPIDTRRISNIGALTHGQS